MLATTVILLLFSHKLSAFSPREDGRVDQVSGRPKSSKISLILWFSDH